MLRVTDVTEGPKHVYQGERYTHYGAGVMINHPCGYVVSGGGDYHTKVWDPVTLKLANNFHASTHYDVKALAVSHNGKFIASGHGSWGGVHLWDMDSGDLLWCYDRLMFVDALAFDKNDTTLVALKGPDSKYVFDVHSGEHLVKIDGEGSCDCLTMQKNAKRFFVADGPELTAYETTTGKPIWRLSDFTDGEEIEKLVILPDDKHMAVIHGSDRLIFVRNNDGALGQQLTLDMDGEDWDYELPMAITSDLQIIAIATVFGQIRFYRSQDGGYLTNYQLDDSLIIEALLFTDDGRSLIVGDGSCDCGATYVLNLERSGMDSAIPFNEIEWQLPNVSGFDRFILDNNLTVVAGYYHSDEFIEAIKSFENDRLRIIVSAIRDSAEGNNGNCSVILQAVLDRAKVCQADLIAAETAILLLREGLPSAGAVIHDAWGMMDSCAKEGCDYLRTYPLETLPAPLKELLARNLVRAIAVNEALGDIGISGLDELKNTLKNSAST